MVTSILRMSVRPERYRYLLRRSPWRFSSEVHPRLQRALFGDDTPVEPLTLIRLIQEGSRKFSLDGQHKLRFRLDLSDAEKRFTHVHSILDRLDAEARQ